MGGGQSAARQLAARPAVRRPICLTATRTVARGRLHPLDGADEETQDAGPASLASLATTQPSTRTRAGPAGQTDGGGAADDEQCGTELPERIGRRGEPERGAQRSRWSAQIPLRARLGENVLRVLTGARREP